jgi:hypothetical protein
MRFFLSDTLHCIALVVAFASGYYVQWGGLVAAVLIQFAAVMRRDYE